MTVTRRHLHIGIVIILALTTVIAVAFNRYLGSTPDGWTAGAWSAYSDGPSDGVIDAIQFIQSSSKRRRERDIYLKAINPDIPSINGHVAAISVEKSQLNGNEHFRPLSEYMWLVLYISSDLKNGSQHTFSEGLIRHLNVKIENDEHELSYLDEGVQQAEDNSAKDNKEKKRNEFKANITRYKQAEKEILAIGD